MTMHLAASPVLTAEDAAGRLRDALPRGARASGTLWMLPFCRVTAHGPVGETRLDILAANLGDPRLHNVRLPDVDLLPFEEVSLPGDHRLIDRTADEACIRERARSVKFEADDIGRLIHYPFWRLSINDAGRRTEAWVDAVAGSVCVHDLEDRSRMPSEAALAALLAIPAVLMVAAEIGLGGLGSAASATAVAAGTAGALSLCGRRARAGGPPVPPRRGDS